jgi:tRNA dimethylallyltransferase
MLLTGKRPLIVLLGPTAVGKTGLAIQMAQVLNGEIIGADSRQVYRQMDIGTAKPTAEERAEAIHHLIDIVNPDETLSLSMYQQMAYQTIDAIHQRGHIPLLVGGTGQYITATIEGWSIPEVAPNPALRAELEAFAAEQGANALYARLVELDPVAAEKIHPNNIRRTVRALEVCIETGQPFSELQRKQPPPYVILQYGLTLEREQLYEQADQRVEQMIVHGLVDEVQRLLDMGYAHTLPSMSSLGYRELSAHILNDTPLAEAIELTQNATHDFIRRQYTWFRGHDSGILWHNREDSTIDTILESSLRWLDMSG